MRYFLTLLRNLVTVAVTDPPSSSIISIFPWRSEKQDVTVTEVSPVRNIPYACYQAIPAPQIASGNRYKISFFAIRYLHFRIMIHHRVQQRIDSNGTNNKNIRSHRFFANNFWATLTERQKFSQFNPTRFSRYSSAPCLLLMVLVLQRSLLLVGAIYRKRNNILRWICRFRWLDRFWAK